MKKPEPLEEGNQVPDFTTTDDQGTKVSSANLKGSRFLLYFYPRDNTPGCTAQACGFRDLWDGFKDKKTKIFGVSGDTAKSHKNFRDKFDLPFPLLMDENHTLAKAFWVWGLKKFMGREFDGIHRMSFIVDHAGKIEKAYHKVKAKENPAEILSEL
jgi:peroxiredoxin Q/BCP